MSSNKTLKLVGTAAKIRAIRKEPARPVLVGLPSAGSAPVDLLRDTFEREGYAHLRGHELASALDPTALRWLDRIRSASRSAPVDGNSGGAAAARRRRYSIGVYNRRAAEGERFVPFSNCTDRSGRAFVTYLQPPGVNRDYATERQFAPIPKPLLDDPGLQKTIDTCFAACPASLFPNEGRDMLKVGLHVIALEPRGVHPGISSPNRIHVDGEYVTFVILLERFGVIGGESLVTERGYADMHPNDVPFDARLAELTLLTPLDTLVVDDRRLAHYVFPVFARRNAEGRRAVLLLDFTPLVPVSSDQRLGEE